MEADHLVHHIVRTAVKDTPDDLKKFRHYYNHIVRGRKRAAWHNSYEARRHLD